MLQKSISRNSLLLGAFALITTAIIAGTFLSTKEKIKYNIRQAQQQALLEIVPKARHNNDMLNSTKIISDEKLLGLREAKKLFIASLDKKAVAVIMPATARDGYTSDIDLIIGINIDGSIAGVRVLSHRETPGLGDAIDLKKSNWVLGFNNKSLSEPQEQKWTVKKDGGEFDQFTGATITPRAVTLAVKRALQFFSHNRDEILRTVNSSDEGSIDND